MFKDLIPIQCYYYQVCKRYESYPNVVSMLGQHLSSAPTMIQRWQNVSIPSNSAAADLVKKRQQTSRTYLFTIGLGVNHFDDILPVPDTWKSQKNKKLLTRDHSGTQKVCIITTSRWSCMCLLSHLHEFAYIGCATAGGKVTNNAVRVIYRPNCANVMSHCISAHHLKWQPNSPDTYIRNAYIICKTSLRHHNCHRIKCISPITSMWCIGFGSECQLAQTIFFQISLTFSLPYMTVISVVIRQWT